MEQRSQEWYDARLGKVGASSVADATAQGKTGEASVRKNLRAKLIAERLTGQREESYTSAAIQHGVDYEPIARALYEVKQGIEVTEMGWIPHPTIQNTGASPDGLVGEDGLIEIKCPNTSTHIETMLRGKEPSEYRRQMLWQMECTGRKWCDFVSYDPRLPPEMQLFIVRFHRDEKAIEELRDGVILFLKELDEVIAKLKEISG